MELIDCSEEQLAKRLANISKADAQELIQSYYGWIDIYQEYMDPKKVQLLRDYFDLHPVERWDESLLIADLIG